MEAHKEDLQKQAKRTRHDKLLVKDLSPSLNGEYEFDIVELVNVGNPGSLNGNEAHLLKVRSGVRGAEIMDAVLAADLDVFFALAAVILMRKGKKVDVDSLWDHAWGDQLSWELDDDKEDEQDERPPTSEPPPSDVSVELSTSGGESGSQTLDPQENGPSSTGLPGSETSAISVHPTSAS